MKVKQKYFWFNEPHDKPLPDEPIWVDGFAGGGGASEGIKAVIGRDVHVAINHDMAAIGMHMQNHPDTKHYCENIWDVNPYQVTEGREVAGAWFSPDCTHFSKARGSKPVDKKIRGLANVVIRWARTVAPQVIFIENVEEFLTWGPVDPETNKPIKQLAGTYFHRWIKSLRRCGYRVEWRVLKASDYGSPTSRKRLFIVARLDRQPIVWPKPTHGGPKQIAQELKRKHRSSRKPWRTAAEIIDWSLPCPSIFLTNAEAKAWAEQHGCESPKRPLVDNTMKRIAEGIKRYVINTKTPFIVRCNHGGDHFRGQPLDRPLGTITQSNGYGLVSPVLVQSGYGERAGQRPRCLDIQHPLGTVVAGGGKHALVAPTLVSYYGPRDGDGGHRGRMIDQPIPTQTTENRFGLVSAFLAKHYGGVVGVPAEVPFPTITARGTQTQIVAATMIKNTHGDKTAFGVNEPLRTVLAGGTHHAEVRAFLMKYYGTGGQWSACDHPVPTITAKDRLCLGIVMIAGEPWQIVDIGMRMLTPRELFSAQGFRRSYLIDFGLNDKPASKKDQVARCGNSVCPDVVTALVEANQPAMMPARDGRIGRHSHE